MSDHPHGYGPPKVDGYSATMESPATARESLAASAAPSKVKITIHGEGFIERALPLIVKIGDQVSVADYQITPDGRHLTIELDELPEDGAPIMVGYAGDELVQLPELFSRSSVQGGESESEA